MVVGAACTEDRARTSQGERSGVSFVSEGSLYDYEQAYLLGDNTLQNQQ